MANNIFVPSSRGKLTRSKSCVQSPGHRNLSEISPNYQNSLKRTPMSSSRSHHDRLLESSEAPRPELTVEERKIRIINILGQIKKEKPFCDCSLYKMPLTFRSFIWSPYLDSIYDSPAKIPAKLQFLVKSAPSLNPSESSSKRRPTEISKLTFPIRKTLQRSCSEQSLNPSESPSKRKPASSSATNQVRSNIEHI